MKHIGIDADKLKVEIIEHEVEMGKVLNHPNSYRDSILKENLKTILDTAVDRLGIDEVKSILKESGHFKTTKRKAA